ncbi:MAG TPA: crotonase/enoyl-CoA hydratase family protein [Acidimicrobiales bacterium]|jgi:enoyl-CoA hydratase
MTDPPASPSYRLDGGVAVVTLDDGKANALSHAVLGGLSAALDQAEADDARALLLVGRDGKFSAGFDLATMTESTEAMQGLVIEGAELLMRLYGFGRPTVAACTGHALAAGALLLLSCDHRVGAAGPAKIGLNEVAIGMALPIFAVEMARDRLTTAAFGPATMGAQIYDPEGAVAAGYLDAVVPAEQVVDAALIEARRLGELRTGAYGRTKQVAREAVIELILETLEDDMASVTGPQG